MEAWFAGIAVVLSVGTTISQISSIKQRYLSPQLSIDYLRPDAVGLHATISNGTEQSKKIGPVFLLMAPIAENPITTFNLLIAPGSPPVACCAIDFEYHSLKPTTDPDLTYRRLIPLTYFTEENDSIGNETLAFTYPLPTPPVGHPTAISVRLYVYGHSQFGKRMHRKVQSVLILGPERTEETDEYGLNTPEVPACRAMCKQLRGCSRRPVH